MAKKTAPAPAPEIKTLTVPERAVAALGYNAETVKELTTLALASASITEITNTAGYDQCHAARMVLKNRRIEITDAGKDARDDAQKFSKAVIAEEKRLIGLIEPEEKRLQGLQDAHDDAIEAEKQRKIQAEIDRVAGLTQRLERIRTVDNALATASSEQITKVIGMLDALVVDETFEEYQQQASDAKGGSLLRLRDLHTAAVAREEAAETARKNAAELEQLRKEKAERDERDRKAEEQRQANERAEQAERERLEAAAAPKPPVFASSTVSVLEKTAATPPAPVPCAGENCGTTDYHNHSPECIAEHERITSGARFAQPKTERPSFEQIVAALCFHYDVSEDDVRSWICENVVLSSEAA